MAAEPAAENLLPAPSTKSVLEFEQLLFPFVKTRRYVKLNWKRDKRVRDTGPYVDGVYYGTHPAVRVYYSPKVMAWLEGGQKGRIADGGMIIKEQYRAPAARYDDVKNDELPQHLKSWTVMIKDSAGSHDGWFWSEISPGHQPKNHHKPPFEYPSSGFGLYCVRCHASTRSPGEPKTTSLDLQEFTFASLRNVEGFPGDPTVYRVDDSWRDDAPAKSHIAHAALRTTAKLPTEKPASPLLKKNRSFLNTFRSIPAVASKDVLRFPPETHDWVAPGGKHAREFLTSNQCMHCHGGLAKPFGPTMFLPTGKAATYGSPGINLSPYGEWRWSPMGLAGRDPIFYAQLESEVVTLRRELKGDPATRDVTISNLVKTCLSCHGGMGKHQFDVDHHDRDYGLEHVYRESTTNVKRLIDDGCYGGLSRDGISCMICHRITRREQPADDRRHYLKFFLESSITGNVKFGPPGELYGPFKDEVTAPYVMHHGIGIKPKHNPYLKSSQMCGTCHTINLPAVDQPLRAGDKLGELERAEPNPLFRKFHHFIEQATYLEWLNSDYENELTPENPRAKSCQDCHMSRSYHNKKEGIHLENIPTRIATIQDETYPESENLADHKLLNVRFREKGYARHQLQGLNVFLVEMFNQFDGVLGVRKTDYMTGSKTDLVRAVENFVRQARHDTADIDVDTAWESPQTLVADVTIRNKTGHRFPTGVGFRRAFLELLVLKDSGNSETLLWSSGRTNELGIIIDEQGVPLPTEFFNKDPKSGEQRFQPHHEVITSPAQVQIYEALAKDASGKFTTSFIHHSDHPKDNRLLPRGWKRTGPNPAALSGKFLEATFPGHTAAEDPSYQDGSGADTVTYRIPLSKDVNPAQIRVKATLYYQAIPPYYLRERFRTAPDGAATKRLHYLCSHLDLEQTPIRQWKLKVKEATAIVGDRGNSN